MDHDPGYFLSYVVPWIIHKLPDILKNEDFRTTLKVFIEEVESTTPRKEWLIQDTNDTTAQKNYFADKLVNSIDYTNMFLDVAEALNLSDSFQQNSMDSQLREQCLNDTVTCLERLYLAPDSRFL